MRDAGFGVVIFGDNGSYDGYKIFPTRNALLAALKVENEQDLSGLDARALAERLTTRREWDSRKEGVAVFADPDEMMAFLLDGYGVNKPSYSWNIDDMEGINGDAEQLGRRLALVSTVDSLAPENEIADLSWYLFDDEGEERILFDIAMQLETHDFAGNPRKPIPVKATCVLRRPSIFEDGKLNTARWDKGPDFDMTWDWVCGEHPRHPDKAIDNELFALSDWGRFTDDLDELMRAVAERILKARA